MSHQFLIEAPIGLLPSVLFLLVLQQLDSFKLVRLPDLLESLVAGMALAGIAYIANARAIGLLHYSFSTYSHFVAPFPEEFLKAAWIIVLIARNRIGFMIDAAIMGFAVGAGFSLTENLYYLYQIPDANLGVWIVRGFGTAIMHGGATAVFGVMAQGLTERRANAGTLLVLPGLAVAVFVHALYNFFQGTPVTAAAIMIITLPMILLVVFGKSEHKIHTWLLTDYESHEHVLEAIKNKQFEQTEAGRFLTDLSKKVSAETIADLFQYIRLHTELVMRAEKISLAREKGEKIPKHPASRQAFTRLHALEKKIGPAAMMAIWPHLHFSRRELWELNELEAEIGRG
jgi:RsiW-degrading membrane proteinase PrsW (M82 family)